MDLFQLIADERRLLASLALTLTDAQLRTPSLVPTWSVHDTLAHLTSPLSISGWRFLVAVLSSGGFERGVDKIVRELAKQPASVLAARLRDQAENRFAPPGAGPRAPLTDLIVHGLDIRRPLGIPRELPEPLTRMALDFLTGEPSRAFGFTKKKWKAGLRFEATNLDWAAGEGAVLRGHSDDLLLAICGRRQALAGLQGEGVATLSARWG